MWRTGNRGRTTSIDEDRRTQASSDPRDLGRGDAGMGEQDTLRARPALADLQQVDAVCDRFEMAWLAGQQPDMAEFLAVVPEKVRAQLFRDLLSLDLEYRRRLGERPDAQSYCERFPEFAAHMATAFQVQASNSTRRRGDRHDGSGSLSIGTPANPDAQGADGLGFFLHEPQGFKEAGYEVLGELGRGGMGVVLKVHQAALNRVVALKIVKSGRFASESELIRFQAEAEAVAGLDHPHIVPIYEVGVCRGHHFFSMKLVNGTGLDRRLEEFSRNPHASARLVATVAQAVHHAHQRGILHRDLKPANVLVDEHGEPHVTDFGLAKRLDGSQEATQSGALLGTPSYMSPEQANGSRGTISTTTDVYGLGTILYALLAGRAPFAGTTLVDTLEKVRSETPEPPRLLNSRVPRDLEIICLKCLEKEPERRYQSALEVADDLERWLHGVPILARPVSAATRALLWCRRNRAISAMAALFVVALCGGIAGITWKWREADHERKKAEAVNELLTHRLLAGASHELDPRDKDLTVRAMIDATVHQLGGWLQDQPEVEAGIREAIGGIYLSLGQNDQAAPHLEVAVRLDMQLYGPRHRDTLRAGNLMALLLDRTGRGPEAETLARRNLDVAQVSLGAADPITLEAAERLGVILWHQGKTDLAEAVLRKNVDDRRRVLRPEHPDTLRSVYLLSRVLRELKQFADAEEYAYAYAHSIQCSLGTNHPDYVVAITNQADVYRDKGDLVQAERHYGQAAREAQVVLGEIHPKTRAALEEHAKAVRALKAATGISTSTN
jgi:tRNA A-37 threonylcarbamoyl transferase component Bud32/tetratricopeptide (TPR) repeat protein